MIDRRKRRSRRRGFTMLDVLAGSLIVLISVIGLAQAATSAMQLRRAHQEKLGAAETLTDQIATIEATAFNQIVADHGGRAFDVVDADFVNPMLNSVAGDPDGRTGLVVVNVINDLALPGAMLEVIVRIDWAGTTGDQALTRTLRISRIGGA